MGLGEPEDVSHIYESIEYVCRPSRTYECKNICNIFKTYEKKTEKKKRELCVLWEPPKSSVRQRALLRGGISISPFYATFPAEVSFHRATETPVSHIRQLFRVSSPAGLLRLIFSAAGKSSSISLLLDFNGRGNEYHEGLPQNKITW